jgi:hypothetical protein
MEPSEQTELVELLQALVGASEEKRAATVDGDSGVTYTQGQLLAALIFAVSAALAIFVYISQQFDAMNTRISTEVSAIREGVTEDLTQSSILVNQQIREISEQIHSLRVQMAERYVTQDDLERVREDLLHEVEQRCE